MIYVKLRLLYPVVFKSQTLLSRTEMVEPQHCLVFKHHTKYSHSKIRLGIEMDNLLGEFLDELWVWRMAELAGQVGILDLEGKGDSLVPLVLGTGLVAFKAATSTQFMRSLTI